MEISDCSFQALSYSKLFNTYLADYQKLDSFYPHNPWNEDDISKRAANLKKPEYKESFLSALSAYHKELGIGKNQQESLKKLSQENALVVVTGQQLGMYGGPLFTIYKIITAILLAKKYEQKLGRPVVPVFWPADEDHDFEEIAWAGITGRADFKKIRYKGEGNGQPVSEQKLSSELKTFKTDIKEELFDTDFSQALWEQLDQFYKEGKTHIQAFAGLIDSWFADQGLLITGSNHPEIKKLLAPEFSQSIEEAEALFDAIEKKSLALEKIFHRQVSNGDSDLFYLSKKEGRVKIQKDKEGWKAGSSNWTTSQLLENIRNNPENFSPNVFLRPVIQDKLLPTLGYVSGPGELAYYGQMKDFYAEFDLEMPVIFPRLCATLIESGIARIVEKLPFEICEYGKRIEDLESEFIERTDTVDLEEVFKIWKSKLEQAAGNPLEVINKIDPTLDGTVGKTVAGFENELEKLQGRVHRSIKQQEEIQIKRIEKIKVNLFPDGGAQERAVSPVYFMNKYGLDIWQSLLKGIEREGLDLGKHYLVKL
ncbi:MAG: bacillithiol biosynthesis cysteine-adding enzyme BshC [Balneolaceae bacterium]